MDREKQLEKIRQKCIEANPEIVELKFGCRIQTTQGYFVTVLNYGQEDGEGNTWYTYLDEDGLIASEEQLGGLKKTIGRPIRLTDVLLAVHAKNPANKTLVTLESDGQFVEHWFNFSAKQSKLGPTWNLRADDLEKQSDECVTFLAGLLV